MIKTFKFLMAALLVSFGATAFAQCIAPNAPGPPRLWDGERGCYVPNGTPSVQQQNGYGQQQIVYGQQQQVMQMAPALGSGIGSGLSKCETVGGIAGGTIGSLAVNNTAQATVLGAIVGGIAGNAWCNSSGQQVVVQQGQQQVVQTRQVTQQLPAAQVVRRTETAPVVEEGNSRCPLRFNNQEVEVFMVKNSEDCMKVVEWEARRRGWVRPD